MHTFCVFATLPGAIVTKKKCEHISLLTQPGSVSPQHLEHADIQYQGHTVKISMVTHGNG